MPIGRESRGLKPVFPKCSQEHQHPGFVLAYGGGHIVVIGVGEALFGFRDCRFGFRAISSHSEKAVGKKCHFTPLDERYAS